MEREHKGFTTKKIGYKYKGRIRFKFSKVTLRSFRVESTPNKFRSQSNQNLSDTSFNNKCQNITFKIYNDKEFKAEVNVIGQTHHRNLVSLLGFCDEGQQRLLVYEFLSNGTLASFLYGDMRSTWEQWAEIALGIGRGLLYLHEECKTQVIHCDIKPQNILLDEYYNVRIADFGLAKCLMMNQSRTHTGIRGTKGYVAPEWFRNMAITVKVDVYSFGVLLLEIVCCRKSVDMEIGVQEREILTDWAYDCYRKGAMEDLIDDDDKEVLRDMKKLERFLMVAIWCIQEDPSLRPTMKKFMLMLEGIVHVAVPPCPCPYNNNIYA